MTTDDLFGPAPPQADAETVRFNRLRDGVLEALRKPWGESPPRIPEPTDKEKNEFAEAFATASMRRY